jgi:hypothetical protein
MYDGIKNTKSAAIAINEDSSPIIFSNAKQIRYTRNIIE